MDKMKLELTTEEVYEFIRYKLKKNKKLQKKLQKAETRNKEALNIADVSESYLKAEIEQHISKMQYQLDEIYEHGIDDSCTNNTKWMLEKDIEIFNLFLNSR